jgi:hypothetical protein
MSRRQGCLHITVIPVTTNPNSENEETQPPPPSPKSPSAPKLRHICSCYVAVYIMAKVLDGQVSCIYFVLNAQLYQHPLSRIHAAYLIGTHLKSFPFAVPLTEFAFLAASAWYVLR